MDENPQPRIGITERQNALNLLEQHLGADRITFAEFDQRSARIQAATTQSQIDAVLSDLPALTDGTRRWKRFAAPAAFGGALVILAVAVAIVLVDRSHSQAAKPTVVTTVLAPTTTPPATGTTAASSSPTTTATRSTTATTGLSGTEFPDVLYVMDGKKLDGATYYSFDTGPAEVSGTTFTRSVMVEPQAHRLGFVEYNLGRKYIHLDTTIGVRDDATPSGMSMQFQIYADGVLVSDTAVKLGDTVPIHVDFDHPLRLRIQVTDLTSGGDGYAVFGDLHTSAK
ncbi:DUF1707 domain-containing protein [Nocardia sp. BMG111209]|uniref:DUF1707 domain-containing protein n=1 Tax=Nocardia sp. BMG111209 TaxID=1160137 RepID=UPI0003A5999A|nr:DUF1707 domain-containing protein [Nocardia sp. BMG111209]